MAVRRKKMCLLVYGDRRSFQFSRVKNKSKSKLLSIFCLDIIYYYTLIFFDTILWSGIHVWMFLVVSSGQRYLVRCPRGVDKRWAEDYIHFKSIWANMGGFLDFRSSHRCFFSPLYCLFIISMRDSAKGPMAPLAHRVGLSVTESPNTCFPLCYDKSWLVPGIETQKHLPYTLHNYHQWGTLTFPWWEIWVKCSKHNQDNRLERKRSDACEAWLIANLSEFPQARLTRHAGQKWTAKRLSFHF